MLLLFWRRASGNFELSLERLPKFEVGDFIGARPQSPSSGRTLPHLEKNTSTSTTKHIACTTRSKIKDQEQRIVVSAKDHGNLGYQSVLVGPYRP